LRQPGNTQLCEPAKTQIDPAPVSGASEAIDPFPTPSDPPTTVPQAERIPLSKTTQARTEASPVLSNHRLAKPAVNRRTLTGPTQDEVLDPPGESEPVATIPIPAPDALAAAQTHQRRSAPDATPLPARRNDPPPVNDQKPPRAGVSTQSNQPMPAQAAQVAVSVPNTVVQPLVQPMIWPAAGSDFHSKTPAPPPRVSPPSNEEPVRVLSATAPDTGELAFTARLVVKPVDETAAT
jgi:hypothetical protein